MLRINPNAVPFALTADNKVPEVMRDSTFWDDSGDVLLITKDKIVVLFRKALLLRYSEVVRSLLGHIAEQPQDDRWMPILELECNATELRAVLEYLLLQEQGTQLSIDSLARYAFSAHTLCIDILDEAALGGLLTCMRDRIDAYSHWDGIAEFRPPPVRPDHAILASRTLPDPASSMLSIAFIDGSIFGFDGAALDLPKDAPTFRRRYDEDTIALLQDRNSELVDSLLKLSANFGRRRSLSKAGRPCCNFEAFAADHASNTRADATVKGRSALSIIADLGAQLEEAKLQQALPMGGSQEALLHPFDSDDNSGCLSCLTELHQGMRRLYGLWWEDMGRLLMGEPKGGHSAWDDVRDSLSVPQPRWPERLWCSLIGMYRTIVGLLFRR